MKRNHGKTSRFALASAQVPLMLRLFRLAFRALTTIAPSGAARWADFLFFRPQRHAAPAREQALLTQARCHPRTHAGKHIAVYSWGAPQAEATVLLVHGWDGRGAQLGEFVAPLVAAGYRVVTFDAPAHGRSGGRQTNIREVAALLRSLAEEFGPVRAVIAHSFGVACTMFALDQEAFATRVAALGAPATLEGLVEKFARILTLSPDTVARLRARVEQRFGVDVWTRFSPHTLARHMRVPALIVHDEHDREVPIEEGAVIASEWPGAKFLRTRELGHRRLLRDPDVIAEITRFIGLASAAPKRSTATHANA
jgi:pimeloyl-ACP methyl ester carboxylesterase